MKRRTVLLLIALHACIVLTAGISAAAEPTWRAGVAKAVITPEPGLWMAGYAARAHAAEGTMHDLWVKAVALEAGDGHKAVLVSLDLLGLPRAMYDSICTKVKDRCGLERADIMLCASHTHSGPVLRNSLFDIYPIDEAQLRRIEEYSTELEARIVATIAKALDDMEPVQLAAGTAYASFGANRRAMRTEAAGAAAPVDHLVPVVAVRSNSGDIRAILFGYACHATTLMAYTWNGDYPGFTQLALEEQLPGAQAMFIAGCGADQNPDPRRSEEFCQQHGQALANAVCQAMDGSMESISPELETAIELIDLPFGEQPGDEYLQETAKGSDYAARWAQRLLKQKAAGQSFAKSYPAYPVQVWHLGRFRLVALGGEVVVDYVHKIREQLGENTWVAAYANDVMAYIPSSRVRAEGGYEAGAFSVYGLPAVSWSPDIEDRILRTVSNLSKQLDTAKAE